jgi:hypothetical protein
MTTEEQILAEFEQLDGQCQEILAKNRWDGKQFYSWPSGLDDMHLRTRITNLVRSVCGEGSSHYQSLTDLTDRQGKTINPAMLAHYIGVFRAAREDFRRGLLKNLKALVEAEVIGDFTEQAQHLFDARYHIPAASLGGAVLEDTLRKICDHRLIEYPDKTSIEGLNALLAKAEVYDKRYTKKITHLGEVRNNADHGQFDKVTHDDVDDMLRFIRRFTEEFLR